MKIVADVRRQYKSIAKVQTRFTAVLLLLARGYCRQGRMPGDLKICSNYGYMALAGEKPQKPKDQNPTGPRRKVTLIHKSQVVDNNGRMPET